MLRTHTCGELRPEHVGQEVTLCGWVDTTRDHGLGLFIDLRDRYGKTQVVFDSDVGEQVLALAKTLRSEYVAGVTGIVAHRPEEALNPKLATGAIEVRAKTLTLFNKSEPTPVQPSARELPGEKIRLQHRYLDLRREELQKTMILRHRLTKAMRDYFDQKGFLEIETPMLGRSTPEGARDYLVPSRVHPGHFYALPQSPQLYKQILMMAGYDRYMQIARCFRDEDLRADRQPEFTQLDLEMTWVNSNDIIEIIDGLVAKLAKELLGVEVALPLPRMTYDEAMRRFGHDAPDLRYGMELVDVSEIAGDCEFRVFKGAVETGGKVRGLCAKKAADKYSRKGIDELTDFVKSDFGCKGLVWFKVEAGGTLASPTAKQFTPELLSRIAKAMEAEEGDLLLFVADSFEVTCKALNGLRRRLARELALYDPKQLHCSWVVEFPMFEWNPDENRWDAMHHPFTAPRPQDLASLPTDPSGARAQAYDLVINGLEAGGGTIRIHDADVQRQVFRLLGIDDQTATERFGFLLEALKYGAPPHGGIALGLDRMVMIFSGQENIRDVIAFPKTQQATDLMTGAPGEVEVKQLKDLHIKTIAEE